jgi:hypothetical protein
MPCINISLGAREFSANMADCTHKGWEHIIVQG